MKRNRTSTLEKRFWKKVQKTDNCWEWTGTKRKGSLPYGLIRAGGEGTMMLRAHRLSWEIHNGPIPEDKCVLHKCDNPPCVNPNHLFLGTRVENNLDRDHKKRQEIGENHHGARLSEEDVILIRKEASRGVSHTSLGQKFAISRSTISGIIEGKKWKHLLDNSSYISSYKFRGKDHINAKLCEEDVLYIRREFQEGVMQKELGDIFGVSQAAISAICTGKTWKHVKGEVNE